MNNLNNVILSLAFIFTAVCLTVRQYDLASTGAGIFFLSYFAGIANDYYNGKG